MPNWYLHYLLLSKRSGARIRFAAESGNLEIIQYAFNGDGRVNAEKYGCEFSSYKKSILMTVSCYTHL